MGGRGEVGWKGLGGEDGRETVVGIHIHTHTEHCRKNIMSFRLSFPFMSCFSLPLAVPLLPPHVFIARYKQQCEGRIR